MQVYGIFFTHPYKQSGRCKDVFDNQLISTQLNSAQQIMQA